MVFVGERKYAGVREAHVLDVDARVPNANRLLDRHRHGILHDLVINTMWHA